MRRTVIAAGAAGFVMACGGTLLTWALALPGLAGTQAADGTVRVCADTSSGQMRMVGASTSCGSGEMAVEWNVQGRPGIPGPPGPPGLPGLSLPPPVPISTGTGAPRGRRASRGRPARRASPDHPGQLARPAPPDHRESRA